MHRLELWRLLIRIAFQREGIQGYVPHHPTLLTALNDDFFFFANSIGRALYHFFFWNLYFSYINDIEVSPCLLKNILSSSLFI